MRYEDLLSNYRYYLLVQNNLDPDDYYSEYVERKLIKFVKKYPWTLDLDTWDFIFEPLVKHDARTISEPQELLKHIFIIDDVPIFTIISDLKDGDGIPITKLDGKEFLGRILISDPSFLFADADDIGYHGV
jgi:hypothetical protein